MKKLLLIRHAEADSPANVSDFNRPLSSYGQQQATALAKKLQNKNITPQQWVCSPALRTVTTAGLLTTMPRAQADAVLEPLAYDASEKTLLKIINSFTGAYDFMALVGHNPGISYLLLNLTGQIRDVPPCAAILIVFEDAGSWAEVSHDTGLITYYTTPQYTN